MIGAAFSCTDDPAVRAQTVLVIDTDLPTAGAPGEVPVAAVDTLRVDVLDGPTIRESRELVLANPSDLPVSFGALGAQRLRLRLFRTSQAVGSTDGSALLLPRVEVTVDRLVDLPAPPGDNVVTRRRVLLSGECIGFAADLANGLSCTGRGAPAAPAASGILADDGAPSKVGTWAALTPAPCIPAADPDRPCVPGSYDVMGDVALASYGQIADSSAPLRPVVISPFRMDRTEFTVARYRGLRAAGRAPAFDPPRPVPGDIMLAYCTYVSATDPVNDNLPLTCVSQPQARELCHAVGGELPTQAQWEHAARGRDGRAFPWGDIFPSCCTTSASRSPLDLPFANLSVCGHGGVEPVGSHVASPDVCPGGGDVSRDGVLDLGGSVAELVLDFAAVTGACAPRGLAFDPLCPSMFGSTAFVLKGADFTAGLGVTRGALREQASGVSFLRGFRCVYPEVP